MRDLYTLADGKRARRLDDPDEVICLDEFGPLNLQPQPGRQWACRAAAAIPAAGDDEPPFIACLASGTRSPPTTYGPDRLYGHIKDRKRRSEFLAFLRYIRSLHREHERLAIILANFSPHLTTKTDTRLGDHAASPTTSSRRTCRSTPAG